MNPSLDCLQFGHWSWTVWPMNADYACEKSFRSCRSQLSVLATPTAHDCREDVSSRTVVECWRRDRYMSRAFGWMKMLATSPERFTDSDSDAACGSRKLVSNIDLTKERGVYNLYVQVAGGEGNVERAVDDSTNEMEVEVERGSRVSGRPPAGFLTVVRRRFRQEVPPVAWRSRHKQNKMSTMPQAMQSVVRGVSIVSRADVCQHTCVFLKESCLKSESIIACMGPEGSLK